MKQQPQNLSTRREAFAQLAARGDISAAAAYLTIFPKAGKATAESRGPKLLRSAAVKRRVHEIQGNAAAQVTMELTELLQFCADVVRTPVGALDEMSPLIQEVTFDPKGGKKIKMPGKLEAVAMIGKFKGLFAAEKREHSLSSDTLKSWLTTHRSRRESAPVALPR